MEIIRNARVMRDTIYALAMRGREIGLVPTMGALHEGHMSLIRTSTLENHITVVSIFVNPIQFGRGEDFEKYPRDMEVDTARLKEKGVDILFAPDAAQMYQKGFSTKIDAGEITGKLCGAFRPGHFSGVATVVAKLLNIVSPTRAYFGEKDFQQCEVIKRCVSDLNIPVRIITCPTIREPDGLAMSSRNAYLSPKERKAAVIIHESLSKAAGMVKEKYSSPNEISEFIKSAILSEPLVKEVQYAGAYDPETLDGLSDFGERTLLACSVIIGETRLIDNIVVR